MSNTTGATIRAEMFTVLEHLSTLPYFYEVRVVQSLVLCVVFGLAFRFLLLLFLQFNSLSLHNVEECISHFNFKIHTQYTSK